MHISEIGVMLVYFTNVLTFGLLSDDAPSEEERKRTQKIAILLSEEMTARFSAYSIVFV